jgi:uncharacterized membrane protein HdeD (DUF308 family)
MKQDHYSIFFTTMMTGLFVGIIDIAYYAFLRVFRKGDAVYFVFFLAVTAFLAWKITGIHRFTDVKENSDFKGLLGGIVVILGCSAACLPLLYRSRKFIDAVI